MDVADHANHCGGNFFFGELQLFPQWVFGRPVAARQRLVHQNHRRRIGVVLFGKGATLDERDSDGLKIARADTVDERLRFFTLRRGGLLRAAQNSSPRRCR